MNRVVLIVTLLLTAGCASTGPPPPHLNSDDPWAAVVALRRGSDVVVLVSCLDERQPPCDTDGFAVGYRVRLEGTLVEATATSILVDARTSDADPVAVARSPVAALYEVETESSYLGTLIGAAIGTTFCAFAGLYGDDDAVSLQTTSFSSTSRSGPHSAAPAGPPSVI